MKRIITVILLAAMLLSLTGCSGKEKDYEDGKDNIAVDNIGENDSLPQDKPDNKNGDLSDDSLDKNIETEINNTDADSETKINSSDTNNSDRNNEESGTVPGDENNTADNDNKDNSNNQNNKSDSSTGNTVNPDNTDNADNKENTDTTGNISNTDSKKNNEDKKNTQEENKPDKEQKLSELGEVSKKLALQMSKGEFKETHDAFSSILKPQLPETTLKQAWDTTIADMGKYKDIREVTEAASGDKTVIYVVLDYDNSGIQILFSYNSSKKLDGLWISYVPYEEAVVSDDFSDTAISFGDSKNPIKGILTLPKNVKKPPVVILVHGSGNHDADETIGINRPFRDLAYGFASHGIAVIRYNESTATQTKQAFTIEDDSLNDAAQAIKHAQSCGKIDTERIYVAGHSLGGMMAPKIAADNKEVDGIICLAGSPRKLEDIVKDQNRILLEADKSISKAMLNIHMAQVNVAVEKIRNLKEGSTEAILGYPASYWYSLNRIDIPAIAQSLDIPIYIAQGSEDFQVYADIDYAAWQELLKDKENVTFKLYDNLNHLFMASNGRMDVTEYNIKGKVSQQVIDDIAKWILKK